MADSRLSFYSSVSPQRVFAELLRKYWGERRMLAVLFFGAMGLRKLQSHQLIARRTRQYLSAAPFTSPSGTILAGSSKDGAGKKEEAHAGANMADAKVAPTDKGSSTSPSQASTDVQKKKKAVIKVDRVFFRRLLRLMPLLVPHWRSKESVLLVSETAMLVARSLLSIHISELIGDGLQAVMRRSPNLFCQVLADFFLSGVFASFANSALKYMVNLMSVWFRENLTREVHGRYMQDRNYYRTAVLMQAARSEMRLDNVDQRIVADLQNFTKTLADLYSRTFKPALDVVLCTRTMAISLGIRGPLIMYSYFVFTSACLRIISPPLAKMTAQQQAVEGDFRRSHARLLSHAEEVAFVAGAAREEAILNDELVKASTFAEHISLKQLQQGIADQFGLKYFASCIGWPVIALPFILYEQGGDQIEWIARYRVADDLIRQASAGFGDLLLVYKKLQTLSGYTARVAELIEVLDSPTNAAGMHSAGLANLSPIHEITASDATIETPDGRTLIAGLTMALKRGEDLLIVGPNGAGKSSLFRTLAGLWPCKEGSVVGPRPEAREVLFLPQTPYLVIGTLRDQVIYPDTFEEAAAKKGGQDAVDASVMEALELAGMQRFASESLNRTHTEWDDVLSGGEKQRIGWARLFFHSPPFAALDEATSAINVQQEGPLYQAAVDRKITLLSIAHRPTVRKFHQWELNILGDGNGKYSLSRITES